VRVTEIFESIQGEGALMGRPMLFIRLAGCNLSCEWCDTPYARDEGREMSAEDVAMRIRSSHLSWVCWTGGEPLLQRSAIEDVVASVRGYRHTVETNGTIPVPSGLFDHVTVSPKSLAGMPPLADCYKFVVGGKGDLEEVDRYVLRTGIARERVYIQPMCTTKDEATRLLAPLWSACVARGYALSPRLHVLVFDDMGGV